MKREIYGFCGFIGSGKDTAAHALIEYTNAAKFSFAAILKDIVAVLFSWDRDMLDGTTPESRQWRELTDEYWTNALGYTVTPRKILQVMGTEVFRNFHKDIWIKAAERRLQLSDVPVAIFTDARFGNEMDFINQQHGKLVWIARPSNETTLPQELKGAFAAYRPLTRRDAYTLKSSGLHASETSFLTEGADKLDVVILNNGSVTDLTACVRHFHNVVTSGTSVIPFDKPKTTIYLERALGGNFQWSWSDEVDKLGRVYLPSEQVVPTVVTA